MVSAVRKALLAAAACAASACMAAPAPSWTAASLWGSRAGEEYADFLAARYAGMIGHPAEAANFYRRSFDRSPDDPNLLESAVFATLMAGEVDTAVSLARSADPSVAAGSSSAQLALVVDEIHDNRGVRALARLRSTNVGVINSDMAGFLAAWIQSATDVDGAIAALSQPQARRVPGGETFYLQGLILSAAGRDPEALKAFGDGARFPVNAANILVPAHARLLASLGEADKAREILDTYVARVGRTAEVEQALAMLDSGQPVKPVRLDQEEGAAVAIYLASTGGLARSSPQLLTMRLSLALHLDPGFAPARLLLADSLEDQDRDEEALRALQPIGPDAPWYGAARIKAAQIYAGLKQGDMAIAAAKEAVAATRRREIVLGAGDIYQGQKRFAESEALYDEVVRADAAANRGDWRPLFTRAIARQRLGRWKEAEADVQLALSIEPGRPELLNFLGYQWVDSGEKVAEGMELIRQAVALRPDQGYIVDSLGWAHYRLGEFEQAVEHLERAAELAPDNAEIIDHLGDAYWRAGRRLEASFEWRDAMALDPDPAFGDLVRRKLAQGLPDAPTQAVASAPQQGSP